MEKEIKLPQISEGSDEATVTDVMVAEGDEVSQEDPIIAVDSDKATVEVPAEVDGIIKELKVKEDDEINTGEVIAVVNIQNGESSNGKEKRPEPDDTKESDEKKEEPESKKEESDTPEKPGPSKKEKSTDTADVPAAPLAKKLARELGVDIHEVNPDANEDQRITREDVMSHAKELIESRDTPSTAATQKDASIPLPDFSKWGETERKSLSSIRKATAKTTGQSWTHIPHVTQFDEAEISTLERFLDEINKKSESKITITAVFTKIVTEALKQFPKFNTSLDYAKKELIYKKYYNVGIAADTQHGLLIPVIKEADKKSISTISEEMIELAGKARDKKLDSTDMEGGNITISNLGGIGGSNFTPIIFPPQVAILGVSRTASKVELGDDGNPYEKNILPLALSYDHRVIDGADAARFLRWIANALEQPISMWL